MNDLEVWAEKMFPIEEPEEPVKNQKMMFKTYRTTVKRLNIHFLALNEEHAKGIASHIHGTEPLLMSRLYSE